MAFQATHIRFALDVKNKYRVKDIKKYVVGTIYPDSRYITGIDRLLTHPTDYLDWHWDTADDFKKGWLVHLLADKIQWLVTKEVLPQVSEGATGQGSEVWVKHTAIKILQDLNDVRKFDIKQYLPYLEYTETPNGEDFEKVKKYNQILSKTYGEPAQTNINSYYEMSREFGIVDELATKISIQVEQYSKDMTVMAVVREIYQKMLLNLQKTKMG